MMTDQTIPRQHGQEVVTPTGASVMGVPPLRGIGPKTLYCKFLDSLLELEIDERTLREVAPEEQGGQNDGKIHGPTMPTQTNSIAV
jgi:hypothetical protein